MCGRFAVKKKPEEIAADIEAYWAEYDEELEPSFNVAPTDQAAVLNGDKVELFNWGLVPSWAKDASRRGGQINARVESLHEKASFKNLIGRQQCIIPCSGYFEWQIKNGTKIPQYIFPQNGEYLFLAGLWDKWISPTQNELFSFTVITQNASSNISEVHQRMPIMLDMDSAKLWAKNDLSLKDLQESSHSEVDYFEVSSQVNSVKNNSPALIHPTDKPMFWQDDLF